MTAIITFESVNKKIEKYLNDDKYPIIFKRSLVCWYAELSERNFDIMMRIAELLNSIPYEAYEEEFDVPDDMMIEIKSLGLEIYNRGGFQALQGCYYIMVNFIDTNHKVKTCQSCWDGVGSWQY